MGHDLIKQVGNQRVKMKRIVYKNERDLRDMAHSEREEYIKRKKEGKKLISTEDFVLSAINCTYKIHT